MIAALSVLMACVSSLSAAEKALAPWPADVPDFTAPKPGEHPRLFFRKSDVAELRRRAATPEGQAIVRRLRFLLNGGDGETMPTAKRPVDAAFGDQSKPVPLPPGAYTIGHAAGYGMLYQLTGDKKFAELGKQCFEWAFDGVRDRDDKGRYSWKKPTGALRCGPSLAAYAIGYDLCYDGWDENFRRKVTEAFMNYNEGPHESLESCALGKRQNPKSNHWGAEIGAGLALLAIAGDPGADDARVKQWLAGNAKCVQRLLTEGWGDHGFFAEGDGPGSISSDTAFIPMLQAWRVAGGKDFITPRPNAQWMTLKWAMLTLPGAKPAFPLRGTYGHNVFSRTGLSGSGTFAQGFGAIADEFKPALLWTYNHTFKSSDDKAGAPCDTISDYPHRAVLALVNWPFGMAGQNPGDVLPRAVADKHFGFYMFRNRWQDEKDIVVTALTKSAKGNYSVPGGEIMVWGLGQKKAFPVKVTGDVKFFDATKGGGVFSTSAGSFGVDFSGASGADALLVLSGPVTGNVKNAQVIEAGGTKFVLMTLGKNVEAKADGDKVVVGGQTISVVNRSVSFAK
jgi:hypothetical protein